MLKLRGIGKKIHKGRYPVCVGKEVVKHILLRYIIHVADQPMHTGKLFLSYITYYLHVSVAAATIIMVPSQEY
jgi:hypothetical protein